MVGHKDRTGLALREAGIKLLDIMSKKTTATAECGATSRVTDAQTTAIIHRKLDVGHCDGCRLTRQDLDSLTFVSKDKNPHRRCLYRPAPTKPVVQE